MKSKELIKNLEAMIKKSWFPGNKKVLSEAIEKITSQEDEISSLWLMLDEIKSSDIKKFKSVLEAATMEVYSKNLLESHMKSMKRKKGDKNGKN